MPEPLHDALAPDAPPPVAGLSDAVITAGRRRIRRGRAALAGTAGAVVLALGVPVAVQLGRTDTGAAPGAIASSAPLRVAGVHPSSGATPSIGADELAVDVALVRYVQAASGGSVRAIEIRADICANADRPTATCTGIRPLTPAMQTQILAGLARRPATRFVATPDRTPPGSSGPGGSIVFLTLGPASIAGNRAGAVVQQWCGFDCVRGDEYRLTRQSGRWRVTGSSGGYVS